MYRYLKNLLACFALLAGASSVLAHATPAATTTSLAITPGSGVVVGTVVTLTATVETTGGAPVTGGGTVNFCNTNNFPGTLQQIKCMPGSGLYGTAQLSSAGTASIKIRLGAGSYSIQAVFRGNAVAAGSTSATNTSLSVGNSADTPFVTATTLADTGSNGIYNFSGSVSYFGNSLPTGESVTLTDTSAKTGTGTAETVTLGNTTLVSPATFVVPTPASVTTGGSTGGETPEFQVIGDFNGDGIPDVAIVNIAGTPNISIFLGNANGVFSATPSSTITLPASCSCTPEHIAVGDFNNDGNLDLAISAIPTTTTNAGSIFIYLGNSAGTFPATPSATLTTGFAPLGMAVGDFNLDGNLDLAVINSTGNTSTSTNNSVSVFLGNGTGNFAAQVEYCLGAGSGTTSCTVTGSAQATAGRFVVAADLNGDGNLDLITSNNATANISILLGSANGTFGASTVYADAPSGATVPQSSNPNGIAVADFNGDGVLDIATTPADSGSGTTVNVLLGSTGNNSVTSTGTLSFQTPVLYQTGGNGGQDIIVGDFNNDGIPDLAVPEKGLGTPPTIGFGVSVLLGSSSSPGTFPSSVFTASPSGSVGISIGVADLNGDGIPDVILGNATANSTTFYVYLNQMQESYSISGVDVIGSGNHSITAAFAGDNLRATSTSTALSLAAAKVTPTVTVALTSGGTPVAGGSATFTATIGETDNFVPTGTVTFTQGSSTGTALNCGTGTIALSGSSNVATCTMPANNLTAGANQTITAVYNANGDNNYNNQTGSLTQTVVTSSTTAVSSSANPSASGSSVTFTASITPNTAMGTVNFEVGTVSISGCGAVAITSGSATCSTSSLSVGVNQVITAIYSGNVTLGTSTGTLSGGQTVDNATITTLSLSTTSAAFGSAVTFTGTVSAVPTASGPPTAATVTFKNAGTTILSANSATSGSTSVASVSSSTAPASALVPGTYSVIANYPTMGSFFASSSTPAMTLTITAAATSTVLTSSVNPSIAGNTVTLTATVNVGSAGSGVFPANGSVNFTQGGSTITGCGAVAVNSSTGVATCTTPALSANNYSMSALYTTSVPSAGSPDYATSTGTLTQVVNNATTITTPTSTTNPSVFGQAVTFSVTVSGTTGGTPTAGTVTFFSNATSLGTGTLNGSGVATFTTTSPLAVGGHSITASYGGNAGTFFAASPTSGTLTQVVNKASAGISVTSSSNPSTFGTTVTFTASFAASVNGTTPTGTVTFTDGATTLGTANISGTSAAFSINSLVVNAGHVITATYNGDGNFQ
jgi:hypothetical protein